ncbi:MAG: hypothetical protein CL907_01520 [Dehalococcoidia bacterium]|nr:hypothetical protein [Dehalococcoidia bacterium]|tara:strand:- start:5667 stop:6848 length:1182 start_codon:yes stop_codon:yes gene_type:complete
MKKISNLIILLVALIVFLNDSSTYLIADHLDKYDGEINLKGTIINGTNPNIISEYQISLMSTQNSSTELIEIDSKTTSSNFEFSKINIDESFTYFLMITHQEIPTIVFLEEIDDQYEVDIVVHDRAFTPEDISIIDYSIMIPHLSPESDVVSILGLISFENIGNKTFYADLSDPNLSGLNLLRFSLPENFENLSVDSDLPPGNVMQIPTGFALSNPVPPGQHQVLYSYSMPRNTTSINYTIRLPFGAKKFKLLAPEKTDINKNEILTNELTEVDEKIYEVLSGNNIKNGEIINIQINKIATPTFYDKFLSFTKKNSISVLIGTSSATILLILIFLSIYRNTQRNYKHEYEENEENELIEKILKLDERFKNKQIEQEEYIILRNSYKKRIKGKI